MTANRFSSRPVIFKRAARLTGHEAPVPAGTHSLETEEVLIDGASRPAYQRVSTRLTYVSRPGLTLTIGVDPEDLEAALVRDAAER